MFKGKNPRNRISDAKGVEQLQHKKKLRRKLVVKLDDDVDDEAKRTKSDELSPFQIIPRKKHQYIDKLCDNVRISIGLDGFKHIKYDTLENIDKEKVEQVVIDILVNFKYTPIREVRNY